MEYKLVKDEDGFYDTKLQLNDGRSLAWFHEPYQDVKPYLDFIFNHVSNFWDEFSNETALVNSIIDEDKRMILDPDTITGSDRAFLKGCGGELKLSPDFDGLYEIRYNGSDIDKYDGKFYIDAGNTLEMKCFDDSGILYRISTFYISDVSHFRSISDKDTWLENTRAMETQIPQEVYDRVVALGIPAEYNKRFGDISIKKKVGVYHVIKYNGRYYNCLTQINMAHTKNEDGSVLSTKVFEVYEDLFKDSSSSADINAIIQPTIKDYMNSITKGSESFSTLKYLEPIYSTQGKPIANQWGDTYDFKMKDKRTNQIYALKVFTKNINKLIEKYRAIESYFSEIFNYDELFVVPRVFEKELAIYTGRGISKIPVIITEWTWGCSLSYYVKTNANNQVKMDMLSYNLSLVFRRLRNSQYAHAGLTPKKIFIDESSGVIRLHDYDNMILPEYSEGILKQTDDNYTFPETISLNSKNADDFAITTILLSVKAIAIDPTLCNTDTNNSSLIFQKSSFLNIAKSPLTSKLPTLLEDSDFRKLYSLFLSVLDKGVLADEQVNDLLINNPYEESASIFCSEGELLERSGKYNEAAEKYRQASSMGNVLANRKLAFLTMNSLIPVEYNNIRPTVMTLKIFKRNLIYKDQISAFNLGVLCTRSRNYKAAARYFYLSSQQGNAIAMCNLSYAFENGLGVKKDLAVAENYLLMASESMNGIARGIVLNAVFGLEPYYELIDSYNDGYE